jgi:NitT/TauT family transport system substrate-binding protein
VHPIRTRLVTPVAVALALAACSPSASSPATGSASPSASAPASASASAGPSAAPTRLVVGLGYIPSVQFAQFYLADQRGYYAAAGLEVELQNKIDPDLVTLVGQGAIDIGEADGTSVIPAVSQGIPVRYAATVYGTNPTVVIAKAGGGIASAADLKGKRIGIPGQYGASWIMLQALLASAGLTPADVTIVPYPDYGQATALQQGVVDAATGYANNEPIALEEAGVPVVVLGTPDATRLPGPGLIVSTATLAAKEAALKAFVAATMRAQTEIAADPEVGLQAAFAAVPELAKDPDTQRKILASTIEMWKDPAGGAYGALDRAGWSASIAFMSGLGLVPSPVTADDLLTETLLP